MKIFKKKNLSPDEKKELRRQRLYAVISGLCLGISFPPFHLPYFMFAAFIPLFFIFEKREKLWPLIKITYITLFVFNLIALYWVGSWTKEADPFLKLSGVMLIFVNPVPALIPVFLFYYARKLFNSLTAFLLFPFFWAAYEFLCTVTDLRFPWLTLANGEASFKLYIQIAEFIGAYGITILVIYANIFFFLGIKKLFNKKKYFNSYIVTGLLLIIIPVFYGAVRLATINTKSLKSVKVGLIQPNLNPWLKWQGMSLNEQVDNYMDLSREAITKGAKLIIWPESALPVYLLDGSFPVSEGQIHELVNKNNVSLLTGMPDAQFYFDKKDAPEDAKPYLKSDIAYTSYNSVLLFQPDDPQVQKYQKIKLVPFGERVPFLDALPFLGNWIKWNVGISSWNVGKNKKVFTLHDSTKIAGIICIESIYPDFVAGFVNKGAQMIAVVTNDSWYGYSSGPFQHKEISVLRAVENRRTVVRAANGGISCIIDPAGNTLESTELFTKGILVGEAQLNSELTFYSKYPYIMPALSLIISVLTILIFIIKKLYDKINHRYEHGKNN